MFETNESAKFGRTVHWIWEATGDYVTIEKGKDGKFFNSKYEGKLVRYARPHVLCFSNQPPDLSMLSADRYNVIQLELNYIFFGCVSRLSTKHRQFRLIFNIQSKLARSLAAPLLPTVFVILIE